jgi:uncharacterized protein involved in type VI secretion and phage assembly
VVRAFDRLHRLSRGRFVRSFINVTDGDLVQQIAQSVGLEAQVDPTTQVHSYVLQANETNLAFLQRRCAALGYLLFIQGKTLYCTSPKTSESVCEIKWGENLREFRPRMTTIGQVNSVTVRGWDSEQKREIVGQARNGHGTAQIGDQRNGSDVAYAAFQQEAPYLVTDYPVRTQATADLLAQAVADRHASRFIEAEGLCGGNPALMAGGMVQISAVGDRFSGIYFVTSTTHAHNVEEGYTTNFTISGLHPATLLSLLTPTQEVNPAGGLVIGVVTDNHDPAGLGRVKVKFPWFSSEHASNWARVVVIGGGAERGLQFLPEIDDEVLIGFEQGDIQSPYVLGGLWNGIDAPPQPNSQIVGADGQVKQRIIRSRTGHTITLDDNDGGGCITISDSNDLHHITLNTAQQKLTIETRGGMLLSARGDIIMATKGSLVFQAEGQVSVSGEIINLN